MSQNISVSTSTISPLSLVSSSVPTPRVLRSFETHQLDDLWIRALEDRVLTEIGEASLGHCLRVEGLPRPLLERVAQELMRAQLTGVELYLIDGEDAATRTGESWRVDAYKVVERRNAEENIVVVFLPPDVQLAAGDSLDISTFRSVPVRDLDAHVEAALRTKIPTLLHGALDTVLEVIEREKGSLKTSQRLEFLSTVAAQRSDEGWIVGASLFSLGLVPDFALLDRPDEIAYRLSLRNFPVVRALCDGGSTPIERILRLPLTDSDEGRQFRMALMEYWQSRDIADVEAWGEVVATDANYRNLALESWPLGREMTEKVALRVDIAPLKLPRRSQDQLPVLTLSEAVDVVWECTPKPANVPGLSHFQIQLLNAERTEVWSSPLIKKGAGATAKRRRKIKDLGGLESGIHFFRVVSLSDTGDVLKQELIDSNQDDGKRTNESDDFLLLASNEDVDVADVEPVSNLFAANFADAELLARWAEISPSRGRDKARPLNEVRPVSLLWLTPIGSEGETAQAAIQFDIQRQYIVRLSQRLRRLERLILVQPDFGGRGRLRLGLHAQESDWQEQPISLPAAFAAARKAIFAMLLNLAGEAPANSEGAARERESVVALCDLCAHQSLVERYATSFCEWLESGDEAALQLDAIEVTLPGKGSAVLVSPTHPLRLGWMLQSQQVSRSWTQMAALRPVGERREEEIVIPLREQIPAPTLPSLVFSSDGAAYNEAGQLAGGWGAFLPSGERYGRVILSLLHARLGLSEHVKAQRTGGNDIAPSVLADKLEVFCRQHPYLSSLVINAVQPGDGALIVAALEILDSRLGTAKRSLRYVVRLFSDEHLREATGSAFRELIDPDRQISEAAGRLIEPGRSYLFPKLSWSRKSLNDFLNAPRDFSAHVTLLFDPFSTEVRVARWDEDDRSSWVQGLVQEAPRRFVGQGARRDNHFTWVRRPAPQSCSPFSSSYVGNDSSPEISALLAQTLRAYGSLQAQKLLPESEKSRCFQLSAVAAMQLSAREKSLLFSAHTASTWVLTLDAHLGPDYFDAARTTDRPGYLLDYTPEFRGGSSSGRQLFLTTRFDVEIAQLMQPAAQQLGLDSDGPGAFMLIEALRSLSGRLALQLSSSPSQVQGALGMALSRVFAESYGLLQQTLIIPLDAHPELTTPESDSVPHLRGDLLLVSCDDARQHLDFLLVEAKCHAGIGLTAELRDGIVAQLANTKSVLRSRFDPGVHSERDRLDRSVQNWRLATVLNFYLDRAVRYGLIEGRYLRRLRRFFNSLDGGYTLSVRQTGLVFRLDADTTFLDTQETDVPIWVVGGDDTRRMVQDALRRYTERTTYPDGVSESSFTGATMMDHPTWQDVRRTFAGPRNYVPEEVDIIDEGDVLAPDAARQEEWRVTDQRSLASVPIEVSSPPSSFAPASSGNLISVAGVTQQTDDEINVQEAQFTRIEAQTIPALVVDDGSGDVAPSGHSLAVEAGTTSVRKRHGDELAAQAPYRSEAAIKEGQAGEKTKGSSDVASHVTFEPPATPPFDVLLGDSKPTPQWGMLGTIAAEPWRTVALDLNGCNTLSIFGVQGSGKSYTVGSIIEMATLAIKGCNQLPRPLGAVVFHYHQTQDYPPEFVSMRHPNDEAGQVKALREMGIEPNSLDDVLILTTADTITQRRREFPGVTIEPIAFASSELVVADWRFLMGATGNDALYLKLLNDIMRREKAKSQNDKLTLEAIRQGLSTASASFSEAQMTGAQTRLEFAARFIDDSRSLRSLFVPGRLIIVDLRDEFIEKEQALGLFVTLLNVFSGAGLSGDQGDEKGQPFNKLIVFDEAHKYMSGQLVGHVVEVIREMRHKGVTAIVASQDPVNVPAAIIELSSAIILHRFNSPNWLKHIQKSLVALNELTAAMMSGLAPGEAFVWSNKATDNLFTRRAVKLRLRPRVTKHGGSTRNALP